MITVRGTDAHTALCDAAIDHGGYVVIADRLFRVEIDRFVRELDAFAWLARPARYAGRG